MKRTFIAAALCGALLAASANAETVNVSLGESNETFTLYGLGPSFFNPGLGTFAVGQGASVYDPVTDRSTFTLSGSIAGGTAGYDSGTYDFVTSYAGMPTPMAGPNEPLAQSNPSNVNYFFYTFIDPSTDITVYLNLASGTYVQPLFASDNFVPGTNFSFTYTNATCTGVAVCSQNNVGLTPGATYFGPVTTNISFEIPDAPPPSAVPEPAAWALTILGFGAIGATLRRKGARAGSSPLGAAFA